jgi:hypothetical protein
MLIALNMTEPPDWVNLALRHRRNARAQDVRPADAFLITDRNDCTGSTYSRPLNKQDLVTSLIRQNQVTYDCPRAEAEARTVFNMQTPAAPTLCLANDIRCETKGGLPHLPGGAPLVDHVAAFLTVNPDWNDISPHIEALRASRLPSPDSTSSYTELIIGWSTPEEWRAATERITRMGNSDDLFPFLAADTESVQLRITWAHPEKGSAFKALTEHIQMNSATGDVSQLSFRVARRNERACGFPVRFFVGNARHTIHVILPVVYKQSNTEMILMLDTDFIQEITEFFLAIGTTVGVGITADFVDWARILRAIWDVRSFQEISPPIELEDLARLARINMLSSSLLHLNYWCFGTVLPKYRASTGDGLWGKPYKTIPEALRRYLAADTEQSSKIASLLCVIITIQTFPDVAIMKEASYNFNTITFLQWHHGRFLKQHVAGWVRIIANYDGVWESISPRQTWQAQATVSELYHRIHPPSLQIYMSLWFPADWPSLTGGGPRSIHQVRFVLACQLTELRTYDPQSWPLHHEDKKLVWRYGLPKAVVATALESPVTTDHFSCAPGVENPLPLDPMQWTASHFTPTAIEGVRGERAIIMEFIRIHPDLALRVHEMTVIHRAYFKKLVTSRRLITIILDIRSSLRRLNIEFTVPSPDPYHIEAAEARRANRNTQERFALLHQALGLPGAAATQSLQGVTHKSPLKRPPRDPSKLGTVRDELRRPVVLPRLELMEQGSPPDWMDLDRPYPNSPATDEWRRELDKNAPLPTYNLRPIESPSPPFIPDEYGEAEDFSPEPKANVAPGAESDRLDNPFNYNQMMYSPVSPASIPDDPPPPPAAAVPQPLLADPIPAVYQQGASAQYVYNHAINQPEANVIGNRAGVTLRAGDLLSVIGREWLNDNIINYYFSMLAGRANQSLGVEVYCFSTFFYPSLTTGHTNPRCWTSGIDIFKKDFVLFPIHDNFHWYLAVFNVRRGTLNVYDSIPSPERRKTVLRRLRDHIRNEHRIKRGAPYPHGLDEASSPVVPTQNNSHDCGVFTCQFAKAILQGAGFHFCSKDMPVIRRTMIWEIVMLSISWDHVNPDLMNAG